MTEQSRTREGLLLGGLGVLAFSLSLPATRASVPELGSVGVGLGRALVAAVLAGVLLAVRRERLPERRHWPRLALVAGGVVVGFPLLSAMALRNMTATHGAVLVGLLPAATAVAAVFRARERPSVTFWLASAAGLAAVLAFAAAQGAGRPTAGDGLVLLAVAASAVGYAEGGALSRELGGWRVLCWALVLSAPVLLPIVAWSLDARMLEASPRAWAGFAYLCPAPPAAAHAGLVRAAARRGGGARHAGCRAARGGLRPGERAQSRAATARARGVRQGTVRISAPFSVTRRVCSNWALRLPSAVTAVHPSSQVRLPQPPRLIIGSTVKIIPGSMRVLDSGS